MFSLSKVASENATIPIWFRAAANAGFGGEKRLGLAKATIPTRLHG